MRNHSQPLMKCLKFKSTLLCRNSLHLRVRQIIANIQNEEKITNIRNYCVAIKINLRITFFIPVYLQLGRFSVSKRKPNSLQFIE